MFAGILDGSFAYLLKLGKMCLKLVFKVKEYRE